MDVTCFGKHCRTHVDASVHFIKGRKKLEKFYGKAIGEIFEEQDNYERKSLCHDRSQEIL